MSWTCRRRRSRPGDIVCSFSAETTGKLIIEGRRAFYRSVTGNADFAWTLQSQWSYFQPRSVAVALTTDMTGPRGRVA